MLQLTELGRSQLEEISRRHIANGVWQEHRDQIDTDLRDLGAVAYDLRLPETHTLPMIIHPHERIAGIVYGRYKKEEGKVVGRGALVATDRRVLLLDKKPLFVRCDEISYGVISAITYSKVWITGTIVLHTRMGDISIRTFNQNCAHKFVEAIEANIFKSKSIGTRYDYIT